MTGDTVLGEHVNVPIPCDKEPALIELNRLGVGGASITASYPSVMLAVRFLEVREKSR